MATSQYALKSQQSEAQEFAQFTPIDFFSLLLNQEHISLSQLLGRDYIFIDANRVSLPFNQPEQLHPLLDELILQLELAETHTVLVTYTGSVSTGLVFTRHDLTWQKHKVCCVETFTITQQDQHEFMDMIWQCSSPVALQR